MLRKYSHTRSLADNLKLGALTALTAGMVNVASFIIFLSFSSNVTGYFAIFSAEIVKGNIHQGIVVAGWILLFFFGSFVSNLIVIHMSGRNKYLAHALPLVLEIVCLMVVGIYGEFFYRESLTETEGLLSLMLFAMGLQNGLTASITNFSVKTTHLTGATTDLGILLSMFTKRHYRENRELADKAKLIVTIMFFYVAGAIVSAIIYQYVHFKIFYIVCLILVFIVLYDWNKMSTPKPRRKKTLVKIE